MNRYPRRVVFAALLSLVVFAAQRPASAAALTVEVVDQSGAALPDAVVYATPVNGRPASTQTGKAIIDQIDREFVPLVSVVQTGTSISFPNKDDVEHDVYSFSPAKKFELKLYSGVPSHPVMFDKPGLVVLGCNIHDSMIAYVLVVDTPYFAKTGKDGRAAFDSLPPAEYRLAAWHHAMPDGMAQPVQDVKVGSGVPVKFTLQVNPGG